MALRGVGGSKEVQSDVSQMRQRMADFADKIRSEGKFKNIVHIGIGGSDLGPRLVADGFQASAEQSLTLRFAENVDGASINDAVQGLDPAETLVVIVSKSFGTQETKMNGESARGRLILEFARRTFSISGIGSGDDTLSGAPSAFLFRSLTALMYFQISWTGQPRWMNISEISRCKKTCQ